MVSNGASAGFAGSPFGPRLAAGWDDDREADFDDEHAARRAAVLPARKLRRESGDIARRVGACTFG